MIEARRQSPEEIEREIDRTRTDIDRTLTALQDRLSPAAIVDRSLRSIIDSGGDVASGFGRVIRDNPIPFTLLGISVAWLIVAGQRRDGRSRALGSRSDVREEPRRSATVSTVTVDTMETTSPRWAQEHDVEDGAAQQGVAEKAAAATNAKTPTGQQDRGSERGLRMGVDRKAESVAKVARTMTELPNVEAKEGERA